MIYLNKNSGVTFIKHIFFLSKFRCAWYNFFKNKHIKSFNLYFIWIDIKESEIRINISPKSNLLI